MRFINGLLVGILLTVGTAYVVDAVHAAPGPGDKAAPQRMVNWDVVSQNLSGLSSSIKTGWSRVVGGAQEVDKSVQRSGS